MRRKGGNEIKSKKMQQIINLESFGITSNEDVFATRSQIQELYGAPVKTVADNVNQLKEDGLINGAKIRLVAKDGKSRMQEVFTLQEVIKIGFRLRSDTALKLQDYAARLMVEKMQELKSQKRTLELELSYAWNAIDSNDLYR